MTDTDDTDRTDGRTDGRTHGFVAGAASADDTKTTPFVPTGDRPARTDDGNDDTVNVPTYGECLVSLLTDLFRR